MSSREESPNWEERLREYKFGDILCSNNRDDAESLQRVFRDAYRGELDGFKSRIAVFGMTGSGKSALINTIHKILNGGEQGPAVVQSAGGEGTLSLEYFFLPHPGFNMVDTRGFFDLDSKIESAEFFRILYGGVRDGEVIDREELGARKAASVGTAAHKMNKPPLSRQVHTVLWVIKADDIRLANDRYKDKFKFVRYQLSQQGITIITVITHRDLIQDSVEEHKQVIRNAQQVTGSHDVNTFLISNWLDGQQFYDVIMQDHVLTMMRRALECAENSVKLRQTKRSLAERQDAARMAELRRRGAKMPTENYDNSDMNSNY
ncbi:uncharacterized protein LOC116605567 [Nematostella vectensis]|uniref:uncharacterized protein LOC116605567 n=1 Tax=Nematostella vectensis TaxID=45351 RepID=UPI0020777596|nr:uncharacterized protein LOC116605567 [Nematostella vectensis]